jgi:hypothetical protein
MLTIATGAVDTFATYFMPNHNQFEIAKYDYKKLEQLEKKKESKSPTVTAERLLSCETNK